MCKIIRQLLYTLLLDKNKNKNKKVEIETKDKTLIENDILCELIVFSTIRYLQNENNGNDSRRRKTKFQILNSILIFYPFENVNNIFSDIPNDNMMYDNNLKLICKDDNSNLMVFCDCLNMALENVINNFEKDFDESREEVESSENDLKESEEASMFIAQLVNKVENNYFFLLLYLPLLNSRS